MNTCSCSCLCLRQRGAALLAAMLTVTLVATFAATALWQQWRSIEIETAERARVQSAWILIGALDWSRLILYEDKRAGDADHLAEPWAVPLEEARLSTFLAAERNISQQGDASTDTTDAFLSGHIIDLESRLNLANLITTEESAGGVGSASGGVVIQKQVFAQFSRLFTQLALPLGELTSLAEALRQAQQTEGASTHTPLRPQTIEQLPWLGVSASTVGRLAPYVALLPQPSKLNLNTAGVDVLMASIEGLDASGANKLLAARQLQHFRTLGDARSVLGNQRVIDNDWFDVRSDHFEVHGRLRLGDITVQERSLVVRQGLSVRTVWRERGAQSASQPPPTMAREPPP